MAYPQKIIEDVDELSYDMLMCLRTGMPVSTQSEYRLCSMLEDADLSLSSQSPNLRELIGFFLDNGIDGA